MYEVSMKNYKLVVLINIAGSSSVNFLSRIQSVIAFYFPKVLFKRGKSPISHSTNQRENRWEKSRKTVLSINLVVLASKTAKRAVAEVNVDDFPVKLSQVSLLGDIFGPQEEEEVGADRALPFPAACTETHRSPDVWPARTMETRNCKSH